MEQNWQVGQLYLGFNRNGLPVWKQPGGPGTIVYPQAPALFPQVYQGYQQQVMSYPSLYVGNCNHSYNCLEIFEVYEPSDGTQVALACCPVCSAIQAIYNPWDSYWNYEETPLVIA
ncbi:MAG: hypothetical protein ACLQVL_36780 [Terriglobia bacterium]